MSSVCRASGLVSSVYLVRGLMSSRAELATLYLAVLIVILVKISSWLYSRAGCRSRSDQTKIKSLCTVLLM